MSVYLLLLGCPSSTPPSFEPPETGPDTRIVSPDVSFGSALAEGDFDGDGQGDIAVSSFGATSIFSGPFSGPLTPEDASATLFGDTVSAGDIDGDGVPELMTRGTENTCHPIVHLYRNPLPETPEEGSFASLEIRNSSLGPPLVEVADLYDAPGDEIIIGAAGYRCLGEDEGSKLVIFSADASGELSSETDALSIIPAVFAADSFYSLELADLSGDGRTDLLTSLAGFNHPDESYLFVSPLPSTDILEDAAVTSFVGNRARLVGDIDGDGREDVGLPTYASLQFFTGPLGESPVAEADLEVLTFDTPQRLDLVPAGDIDGDGVADLLIIDAAALTTDLFYGPLTQDATADMRLRLEDEGVHSFTSAIPVPDVDGNETTELLLGGAADIYGRPVGVSWLIGLPFAGL